MAILGFTGMSDLAPFAFTSSDAYMLGYGEYLTGKLKVPVVAEKSLSMWVAMFGPPSPPEIAGRFSSSTSDRWGFRIYLRDHLVNGPVGASFTFGYKVFFPSNRPFLRTGFITNTFNSLSPNAVAMFSSGVAGYNYFEICVKKVSETNFEIVNSLNGGAPTSMGSDFTFADNMAAGSFLFIGFSGVLYGNMAFGDTVNPLQMSKFYTAYNEDGETEFIGEPEISRVAQTVTDMGSFSTGNPTSVSGRLYPTTGSMDFYLNTQPGDQTLLDNTVGSLPIVSSSPSWRAPGGQEIRAIQVTSFTRAPSATARSASKLTVKNTNGDLLGELVSDYLSSSSPSKVSSVTITDVGRALGATGAGSVQVVTELSANTK
ncbi:hypothetical protein [Salmonella phage SSBI34]|nr:hypothetical protein [Salmonella phage SSBI34]